MKTHSTRTLLLLTAASLGLFAALIAAQPAAAQGTAKQKSAASRASSPAEIDKKVDAAANAYQAGRYAEAANLFREVVKLDPRHMLAWHFLGQSLVRTGETTEARTAFQRVLGIEPSGKVAERTREALAKLPLDGRTAVGDFKDGSFRGQQRDSRATDNTGPAVTFLPESRRKGESCNSNSDCIGALACLSGHCRAQ